MRRGQEAMKCGWVAKGASPSQVSYHELMAPWPTVHRISGAISSQCRCQFAHLFTPLTSDSWQAHSPYLAYTRDPKGVLMVLILHMSFFWSMSRTSSSRLIPRPLSSKGRHAFSQETLRWRLGPSSLPSHKNDVHICRMERRTVSGTSWTAKRYSGMLMSTWRISWMRPPGERSWSFHPTRFFLSLLNSLSK